MFDTSPVEEEPVVGALREDWFDLASGALLDCGRTTYTPPAGRHADQHPLPDDPPPF